MRYSYGYKPIGQTVFGGYDRRAAAPDGAIYRSINMCADAYPALTTRQPRAGYATAQDPAGFLVRDCVAWVAGRTSLVVDGETVAELPVAGGRKLMVGIQRKICIWPDKVIYDRETGELTGMEAVWEGEGAFGDGTYAGEAALANTITVSGDLTGLFRAGDGVAVTVRSSEDKTYGAYVIQEIEYDSGVDQTELRFYEETWRDFVQEAATAAEGEVNPFPGAGSRLSIVIRRRAPELEGAFEHHNRIWGWSGGTIYCSKLGDPSNWECYDGHSTDSWELQTGSPGCITGGISYGAHPVLFKERSILRIYGDYPQQFALSETESLGVERGSEKSLAIAGDTLYYKSTEGVMAYSGGIPWSVAEAFGGERFQNAVAGSDGVRYYISMDQVAGSPPEPVGFCYDTRYRVWHQETGTRWIGAGWKDGLYVMDERGEVTVMRAEDAKEDMASTVEFADFTDGTTEKKAPSKLMLRLEAEVGETVTVSVRYDSRGEWVEVGKYQGEGIKEPGEIILPIRRCDHYRVRLRGTGKWTLHALTRYRRVGSTRR
jgi:hypothetical protein